MTSNTGNCALLASASEGQVQGVAFFEQGEVLSDKLKRKRVGSWLEDGLHKNEQIVTKEHVNKEQVPCLAEKRKTLRSPEAVDLHSAQNGRTLERHKSSNKKSGVNTSTAAVSLRSSKSQPVDRNYSAMDLGGRTFAKKAKSASYPEVNCAVQAEGARVRAAMSRMFGSRSSVSK